MNTNNETNETSIPNVTTDECEKIFKDLFSPIYFIRYFFRKTIKSLCIVGLIALADLIFTVISFFAH